MQTLCAGRTDRRSGWTAPASAVRRAVGRCTGCRRWSSHAQADVERRALHVLHGAAAIDARRVGSADVARASRRRRSSTAITRVSLRSVRRQQPVDRGCRRCSAFWVMLRVPVRVRRAADVDAGGLCAAAFPLVTDRRICTAFEARPYGLVLGVAALALVCWQSVDTEPRTGRLARRASRRALAATVIDALLRGLRPAAARARRSRAER